MNQTGWILAIALLFGSSRMGAQEKAEPQELTEMRLQFEKALRDAVKPVMRSYGQALRKKMTEYTQAGKLDEALAFKREMEKVAADLMRDVPKPPDAKPAVTRRNVINFLEIIDTELDGKPAHKWLMKDGKLMCVEGHMVPKIVLPYEPPEEFDITMTYEQPRLRNGVAFIIPNGEGKLFTVCASERGGMMSGLSVGGRYDPRFWKIKAGWFRPDKEYTLTVEVREDSVTGKVDGDEVFTYEGDRGVLESTMFFRHPLVNQLAISADDPTVFSKLEVTEISGTGKLLRK